MALSIVEAIGRIKAGVAKCLTAESIERVCHDCGHRWRQREVGPVQTVWTFLTQILHGNTACAHAVRLAALSCSTEAYCQARSRLPLAIYERLLEQTSRAATACADLRPSGTATAPCWWTARRFRCLTRRCSKPNLVSRADSALVAVSPWRTG